MIWIFAPSREQASTFKKQMGLTHTGAKCYPYHNMNIFDNEKFTFASNDKILCLGGYGLYKSRMFRFNNEKLNTLVIHL